MSDETIRWEGGIAVPREDTMEHVYTYPLMYKTNYVQTANLDSGHQLLKILTERRPNVYTDSEEGSP